MLEIGKAVRFFERMSAVDVQGSFILCDGSLQTTEEMAIWAKRDPFRSSRVFEGKH